VTNREFLISRRKNEVPTFVKVLRAVLQSGLGYRPEPRSRTAAELAWLLATEEAALLTLIETGSVEWKESSPPERVEEIVSAYERDSAAVDARIAALDEEAWERKVQFLMAGAPPWEDTLSEFVWGFLVDAIHHRGQLSTYLRPMGGKVPSIYGPSADSPS
jgi:uncharacterized damage-inducible protein DinB